MRRRYKTKLRFKQKKQIAIRFLIAVICGITIFFLPQLWKKASHFAKNKLEFSKNISSISADFNQPDMDREIEREFSYLVGKAFNDESSAKIKTYFAQDKPFISDLSVKYNRFIGTLSISGKLEKPCAILEGEEKSYILSSGKIVRNSDFGDDFILVSCKDSCSFNSSFASFSKDLYSLSHKMGIEIDRILYDGKMKPLRIMLKDGSEILWGNYMFTREKIEKLIKVLKDSSSKIEGPVKADLRFFESGKIIVSKVK